MTAREYHRAYWRVQLLQIVVVVPLVLAAMFAPLFALLRWDAAIRPHLDSLRAAVDNESVYGAIGGLSIAVVYLPLILLAIAPVFYLDRRFGMRCGSCRRSVTLGHSFRSILSTGRCPGCDAFLFEVDPHLVAATTPRPFVAAELIRGWTIVGAVSLLAAFLSPFDWLRATGFAGGLLCSWVGAGLGVYASIRYPSRDVWMTALGAGLAAAWAVSPLWTAIGQDFFIR